MAHGSLFEDGKVYLFALLQMGNSIAREHLLIALGIFYPTTYQLYQCLPEMS